MAARYIDIELEGDTAIDDFWGVVEGNLRDGKIRLIFVADDLPKELRRLIEFMNEKMADVEVLGVTVRQYRGKDLDALVPRVIGVTESSLEKKDGRGRKGRTNRDAFLAQCSRQVAAFFESVLEQAEARGHTIRWGKEGFSLRTYLPQAAYWASCPYGWPWEEFDFYFGHLPLSTEEALALRRQLLQLGVFREGGEKTLRADLTGEVLLKMPEVYAFILDRVDDIVKRY